MQPDAATLDLLYLRLIVARPHHGSPLDKSLGMQPDAATLDLLYLRLVVARLHRGGALDRSLRIQPNPNTLGLLYLRLDVARPHRDGPLEISMRPDAITLDLPYLSLVVAPPQLDSAQGGDLGMQPVTPVFSPGVGGKSRMTPLLPSICAQRLLPDTVPLPMLRILCRFFYSL